MHNKYGTYYVDRFNYFDSNIEKNLVRLTPPSQIGYIIQPGGVCTQN